MVAPSTATAGAAAGGPLAVQVRGLTKTYAGRRSVDGLSIDIPSGSVTGFVGPNGAGKTTTIRMLLGLVRPTEGTGTVLGQPLTDPPAYLGSVGALIEGPVFWPTVSGRRNLVALARLGGIEPSRVDEVLTTVGLQDRGGDLFKSYSLGMKQRLGIAAALLPRPDLLVLDEPTNGLDPGGIRDMRLLLRGLADQGLSVFVSSHLLAELQEICDHLVVISKGALVFQGTTRQLLEQQQPSVVAAPENAADAQRVADIAQQAGQQASVQPDGSVHVLTHAAFAPELNRRCAQAGITLAALAVVRRSLEDVFFELTGSEGQL